MRKKSNTTDETANPIMSGGAPNSIAIAVPIIATAILVPKRPVIQATRSNVKKIPKS
jgi:hypothetical protein